MKNLIVATAALALTAGVASAESIKENRTAQIMNCVDNYSHAAELEDCVEDVIQWTLNNGAHEATKEITSYIEDSTGVKAINGGYQTHAAIAQIDQVVAQSKAGLQQELDAANTALEHTSQNTQHMFDILAVITDYNTKDAKRFTQDPAGLIDGVYSYLVDRLGDLRRAEDRIRELEKAIQWHKEGGYWNPTHW